MLIAWSGHRPDIFWDSRIAERLVAKLAAERAGSETEFICGGQRGVDHWAARAARDLGLPFYLVLPTPPERFTEEWVDMDRRVLDELIARAAGVEVVDASADLGQLAYDLRNEAIIRCADALMVVWTGMRRGGTFQTLCAARMRGIPVEEVLLEGFEGQASAARGL
jgi:uncharacterized phage-like protein YoqJ